MDGKTMSAGIGDKAMDRVTNWVAGLGLATAAAPDGFYDWSMAVSHGAAGMLPILGCLWTAVQIARVAREWWSGKQQ